MQTYKALQDHHAHQKWRGTGEHSWCYSNSKFQTTRCYFRLTTRVEALIIAVHLTNLLLPLVF